MENIIMKSEDKKSRTEVVNFLNEIASKIDSGVVKFVQGDTSVDLEIPENLTLELKVKEKIKQDKPVKIQFEIELEWYVGEEKETISLG
ncbi:MAG: amphi-Trp domain-containing protein [Candidatus Heimdallarchaeota archaeon]|nr:amphi-Trp domain-containing protein [Candidatus Heimdallarchaeota archaeon]